MVFAHSMKGSINDCGKTSKLFAIYFYRRWYCSACCLDDYCPT